ncbi:hypothetical protein [Antarctobacter jejuensis]|uniref:hypothetical protein n=1 Tax=Antarctobacter jejuensis TaxID=1439938 RepID=UPI003FD53E41
MIRIAAALLLFVGLVACTDATQDLSKPTQPMGDFRLVSAVVRAETPEPQKLLVSQDATSEEWIETVRGAFHERFKRFEGDSEYYFGIKVLAYSLPPPVVPGKSALQLTFFVYDSKCNKMHADVHDVRIIQVFESRLALTREERMQRLAETAAKDVEDWLREMQANEGWFTEGYTPSKDAPSVEDRC